MKTRLRLISGGAALFGALVGSSDAQQLISLSSNAVTGGNAASVNAAIVPSALEGPAGGLNTTWNILTANSATNLLDSTGAVTTVGFSTTQNERRGVTGSIGLEVARTFWQFFGKGVDATLTFSGLEPGGVYNVWLVSVSNSSAGTEGSAGTFSTTNATTSPSAQDIDGRFVRNVTTFVQGQNLVFFENVVADGSGVISFLADAADANEAEWGNTAYRLQLNGAQIQKQENVSQPLFAITGIAYNPGADEVTLTWRKTGADSYIAKYSLDMTNWNSDIGDGLVEGLDENPGDPDHMTVTFSLAGFGIQDETDVFFRIEEE